MTDALETAAACGLYLRPKRKTDPVLKKQPKKPAHRQSFDEIINNWYPLTFALNCLNRGMGLPDAYPFILPPASVDKLRFVQSRPSVAGTAGYRIDLYGECRRSRSAHTRPIAVARSRISVCGRKAKAAVRFQFQLAIRQIANGWQHHGPVAFTRFDESRVDGFHPPFGSDNKLHPTVMTTLSGRRQKHSLLWPDVRATEERLPRNSGRDVYKTAAPGDYQQRGDCPESRESPPRAVSGRRFLPCTLPPKLAAILKRIRAALAHNSCRVGVGSSVGRRREQVNKDRLDRRLRWAIEHAAVRETQRRLTSAPQAHQMRAWGSATPSFKNVEPVFSRSSSLPRIDYRCRRCQLLPLAALTTRAFENFCGGLRNSSQMTMCASSDNISPIDDVKRCPVALRLILRPEMPERIVAGIEFGGRGLRQRRGRLFFGIDDNHGHAADLWQAPPPSGVTSAWGSIARPRSCRQTTDCFHRGSGLGRPMTILPTRYLPEARNGGSCRRRRFP